MAKIKIIPKLILDPKEITKIEEIIRKQNVTIESKQDIYKLIKLNTYNIQYNSLSCLEYFAQCLDAGNLKMQLT